MTKRNSAKYVYEIIEANFYFAKYKEEYRVFHLRDRGSKDGRGGSVKAGQLADTLIVGGYRVCNLPRTNGRVKRLHAAIIIWMLHHKRTIPPDLAIDHEDRNRLNNDPYNNLKLKTHRENAINRPQSDNHFIGVFENKHIALGKKRWQATARCPIRKRRISLRCHYTAADAARAHDKFIIEHYGKDAVTNASLGRYATVAY